MMRHAAAIFGVRLGRADINPAVDLARVGVDDFRAQALGKRHRNRRLAHAGRPYDKADPNRAHIDGLRPQRCVLACERCMRGQRYGTWISSLLTELVNFLSGRSLPLWSS